jgi:hypothetical protein
MLDRKKVPWIKGLNTNWVACAHSFLSLGLILPLILQV